MVYRCGASVFSKNNEKSLEGVNGNTFAGVNPNPQPQENQNINTEQNQ